MHCDLSLEALFKLARRKQAQSCICDLAITGLKAEHLELAVKSGWLVKSPAPRYTDNQGRVGSRTHAPHYAITDAGREHLGHLAKHSKLQALAAAL